MPSTYSDLKIQLMATGENATTWGTVTNANLGTAIEQAIAGSENVSFSGSDVTLTLVDTNSSQTARNARLVCTGTSGGPRNLFVPNINKSYIVKNNCADAITVKNSTGTGIAVPPGASAFLFSTGTGVVEASNFLSSLNLGSPLGVAQGGTGLSTLTANAVMIGNGASSPTFVAPGASGNVLTSNGTTWYSAVPGGGGGGGVTSISTTGAGISASASTGAVTLQNTGVTSLIAGSNITLSGTTGAITISASGGGGGGGGTVTSVVGTGSVNGITLTGTVTSSGSITLGGTLSNVNLTSQVTGVLPIANGGTGASTAAAALTALGALGITASSLANDGYVKLSNGLIIQWGVSYQASAAQGIYVTNYPTNFSAFSVCVASGTVEYNNFNGQDNPPMVYNTTVSNFTWQTNNPAARVYWIAIGV